jgi:hypothetical protein
LHDGTVRGTIIAFMGKYRRGGYVFYTWVGDHSPRHVHVYRNDQLIVRWDLDNNCPLSGKANAAIIKAIEQLRKEGKI